MLGKKKQISTTINKEFNLKVTLDQTLLKIEVNNIKAKKQYMTEFSNENLENNIKAFFDDIQTLFQFIKLNFQKRQAVNVDQNGALIVTIVNIGVISKQKKFILQTREIIIQKASKQLEQQNKLMKQQIQSLKVQIKYCVDRISQQNKRINFLEGKQQIQYNINMQQGQKLEEFEKQLNIMKKIFAEKSLMPLKKQTYQSSNRHNYILKQNLQSNFPQNQALSNAVKKIDQSQNQLKNTKLNLVPKINKVEINDPKLKKIANLEKCQSGFNLIIKILKINQSVKKYNIKSHNCLVGDSSGTAIAIIPESFLSKLNNTLYLKNCLTLVSQKRIQIRIPDGQVIQSPIDVKQVMLNNNISQKVHLAVDSLALAKKGINMHD